MTLKYSHSFTFDGGFLEVKTSGHGDKDGSGLFVFDEETVNWEAREERSGCDLVVTCAKPDMIDLRDFLNRMYPIEPPSPQPGDNLTPDSAAVHAVLYYGCSCCEEHNPDGTCYPRNMVRVTKDGELICEVCFGDAPEWEYADKPENWNDEKDYFRWSDLPEAPEYVPASRIAAAEKAAQVRAYREVAGKIGATIATSFSTKWGEGYLAAQCAIVESLEHLITAAEAQHGTGESNAS
jgi:hypothetical protein